MTTKRDRFRDIQGRLHDPALTALTIALAFLMFVVGPLQAVGVLGAHHFAIGAGLMIIVGIFIVSGSAMAVTALLVAVALVVIATMLRFRQPSVIDLYLDATAWIIAGATLSVVIARAVFAPARSLANVEAIIGQRDCGPPTVTNEFNINANSSAATGCWRCVG